MTDETPEDILEATRRGLEAMRNAPVELPSRPVVGMNELWAMHLLLDPTVERVETVDLGGGRLAHVVFRHPKPVPVTFNVIEGGAEPEFGVIKDQDSSDD